MTASPRSSSPTATSRASSARTTWATKRIPAHRARLRRVLRHLYHLNAEEEPESPNWPSVEEFPGFNERARPRGVSRSWAVEDDDDTIADGAHLDPETVRMVFELVGAENVVLVTDSMAATGLPDGDYELGPAVGV